MTESGVRISELRGEILALDMRLAAVVTHQGARGGDADGGSGGKISHSPPPWNAAAALCRMDLHALAREIEGRWRAAAGFSALARGGSDENTRGALRALEALSEARGVDARGGVRDLERWARGARMTLGDLERPRRLPPGADGRETRCPWCSLRTLRMLALRGSVICVNPACRDADGARPVAQAEWTGEQIELRWADGTRLG